MRRTLAALAALALCAPAACKESKLVGPPLPCVPEDLVDLTVTVNPTPRFTWSPACLSPRLAVADSLGNFVWQIDADSGSTLTSGITYGVVPAGATETIPAATLTAGHRYAVGVYRQVGTTDSVEVAQAASFRR